MWKCRVYWFEWLLLFIEVGRFFVRVADFVKKGSKMVKNSVFRAPSGDPEKSGILAIFGPFWAVFPKKKRAKMAKIEKRGSWAPFLGYFAILAIFGLFWAILGYFRGSGLELFFEDF